MSLVNGLQSRTSRARLDQARDISIDRQRNMFRLAHRDHGITMAYLATLTGFHPKTISKWANGDSAMDLWAFVEVSKHLPDYLTSLMVEPAGKGLHALEEGEGCFDELAQLSLEYASAHLEARRSERAGWKERLRERADRIRAVAARLRGKAQA